MQCDETTKKHDAMVVLRPTRGEQLKVYTKYIHTACSAKRRRKEGRKKEEKKDGNDSRERTLSVFFVGRERVPDMVSVDMCVRRKVHLFLPLPLSLPFPPLPPPSKNATCSVPAV